MQAQWKYIVFRDEDGEAQICTFPTSVLHADYAASQGLARSRLISAGYVSADRECFGSSSSLFLNSRPRADTALLRGDCDEA